MENTNSFPKRRDWKAYQCPSCGYQTTSANGRTCPICNYKGDWIQPYKLGLYPKENGDISK